MYIIIVLLLMLVLPALSVVNERHFLGSHAGLLMLIGKSFVFWGAGIRLVSAGAHQVVNPKYTAQTILGLKTPEPWLVVRELGIANLAIGTVAVGSIFAHHWLTPAAVARASCPCAGAGRPRDRGRDVRATCLHQGANFHRFKAPFSGRA